MGIEGLPDRRILYHELYRSASAYDPANPFSAGSPLICWKNTKEAKLQGIVLCSPTQMRFNVVVRDQDGTNAFIRKRYRLQSAGMIVDARNWPDSLLKWGANKEICVFMMLSGLSGEVFSADLELLELMG